jgi:hypothetical protein
MSSPADHVALPRLGVLLVAAALGAAACTGSATSATTAPTAVAQATAAASLAPAATAAPTPAPTAAPTDSPAPSSGGATTTASDGPTAVPTAIDPCQLIPAAEAGALAGATFGPGVGKSLSGNGRMCTYGANTKNVFEVIVAVAPDVATAQKAEASTLADLQANAAQLNQGLSITKLPGFAPGADAVLDQLKHNALGIQGVGMNVLKGTVFFAFNDLVLGGAAPSADAMKAEAMTVLGRLP